MKTVFTVILFFVVSAAGAQTVPPLEVQLGYPAGSRLLILHVDDLGVDPAINQSFVALAESGLTVSGSVIACGAFVDDLAERIHSRIDLDVGAHLALTSEWPQRRWGPVSARSHVRTLVTSEGVFRHPWDGSAPVESLEVETEIRTQIAFLMQKGFSLTHLDAHEMVLTRPELRATYVRVAEAVRLPILQVAEWNYGRSREQDSSKAAPGIRLQRAATISPDIAFADWFLYYKELLSDLPPGVSEIILHTALDEPSLVQSMPYDEPWGAAWRIREFRAISSPEFRQQLREQNIHLITWRELGRAVCRPGSPR